MPTSRLPVFFPGMRSSPAVTPPATIPPAAEPAAAAPIAIATAGGAGHGWIKVTKAPIEVKTRDRDELECGAM